MTRPEKILRIVLQVAGVFMLPAFLSAVMPTSWMEWTHRWLGLGELPEGPIVEYLARSLSLFYGIHGGLLILVATDVRRYLPVIFYLSAIGVAVGALLFGIDLYAGMPSYWTFGEGTSIVVLSLAMLYLVRVVRSSEPLTPG